MSIENELPVDVSIVLPVYNESGHLHGELVRIRAAMDASPYSYEIIAVDDGSTDGSAEKLHEVGGITLLSFAEHRGSGAARRWGTHAASGRIVVWTDVDMSYPNEEIPAMVHELEERGLDQLVGARTSEKGKVKLLRAPAKWLIRTLASYLTGTRIPDLNSGLRAFRRDVAGQFLHLLPRGFSCVTTITMAFLTNGYFVGYRPIEYAAREGVSKFHWWKDTRRYLLQVVRMTLLWEPMRVFGPVSFAAGGVGVGKLIFDLIDKDFRVATNTIVLLGVGLALGIVGVLADLLVQLNRRAIDVPPATRRG